MEKFFEGMDSKIEDFKGVGFTIELLRRYGIRAAELGPFAFEYDKKTPEQRKGVLIGNRNDYRLGGCGVRIARSHPPANKNC